MAEETLKNVDSPLAIPASIHPPLFVPLAVTQEHHKPISPSKKRERGKKNLQPKKNDLTVLTFGVLTLMTLMILMFHQEKSTRNKGGGGGGAGGRL